MKAYVGKYDSTSYKEFVSMSLLKMCPLICRVEACWWTDFYMEESTKCALEIRAEKQKTVDTKLKVFHPEVFVQYKGLKVSRTQQ
jgi:hypothetical protein